MDHLENDEVFAFSSFAEALYAYYTQEVKDAEDPFEAYSYQQRLNVFLSPDVYRSRVVRGYRVLSEYLKEKNK